MFTHRAITEADYPQCLALLQTDYGFGKAELARLPELWQVILREGVGHSAVVEDAGRPAGARIIAFGISIFAADGFVQELGAQPRPYLGRRVLDAWLGGSRPFLTADGVRRANTEGGLTLTALHAPYSPEVTEGEAYHRMARTLIGAFAERHSGYRLKALLTEAIGTRRLQLHLGGGWTLRSDYADYYQTHPAPPDSVRPFLVGLTREEALANPGLAISMLFSYTPPRLGFRPAEQALLGEALDGKTDEELAAALSLSLWTVKKRWLAVYDRVAAAQPDLLPQTGDASPFPTRGAEKRRSLLNYLRQHQEELRPVSAPSSSSAPRGSGRQRKA